MANFSPPGTGTKSRRTDEPQAASFSSAFSQKQFREVCCIATAEDMKRLCWEDARRLKDLHGPDVFCVWAEQIGQFSGGKEELQNALMQITAVYLDFAVGYIVKENAARMISALERKLEGILEEYRPVQQRFERSDRRAV